MSDSCYLGVTKDDIGKTITERLGSGKLEWSTNSNGNVKMTRNILVMFRFGHSPPPKLEKREKVTILVDR